MPRGHASQHFLEWLVDAWLLLLDVKYSYFISCSHFIRYMPSNESPLSHCGVCVCVHRCFCAYVWVCSVFKFLSHVGKLSQRRGKHIEGRCVNSSCSTFPSSKRKICVTERVCSVSKRCFSGPRRTFYTIEKTALIFSSNKITYRRIFQNVDKPLKSFSST